MSGEVNRDGEATLFVLSELSAVAAAHGVGGDRATIPRSIPHAHGPETQRDALWEARTWELSIDGYPIDLNAFNIADFDGNGDGASYEYRVWRIRLRNLTEGEHTLYYVMHVNHEVGGDPSSQSPGTYELVVNFTVEK